MHVVDDVHGVDVNAGEPIHHLLELPDDVVEFEVLPFYRFRLRSNLFPRNLIPSSIDRVKQTFGEIGASAKELHLFAHQHWRNTTCDGAVVTPRATHE